MSRNIITAKLDVVFKKFFLGNTDLLGDFLSEILEIPIDDLVPMQSYNIELPPDNIYGKFSRLDISLKSGIRLINVEIQVNGTTGFRDRAMFYWSKLFASDLIRGEQYEKLKETITINILDFVLFPEREDYHAEIVPVIKDSNELFYDKMHIHFFELKKLSKKNKPKSRKEMWLQFINAETEEDFNMLKDTRDPVILNAIEVISEMSKDEEICEIARMREKAERDKAWLMNGAREEGIMDEKRSFIMSLFEQKVPIDVIAKAAKLSVSETEKIINSSAEV